MISILLASYNGEKYISEQIESILKQTETDWTLTIRDDCSRDGTPAILVDYAARYPDKIHLLKAEVPSGGAKYNFFALMRAVKDDYVMLCDQDDVWLPDKVEKTLHKMQGMESRFGKNTPLLVHTDLVVVDGALQTLSPSLCAFQRISPERDSLRNLLVQNVVTGCTAMYNRALADKIGETPEVFVMHDWWLALLAAAFGQTSFLNESTMLYRQHSSNSVGAKDARSAGFLVAKLKARKSVRRNYIESFSQAEEFLKQYGTNLTDGQRRLVGEYARLLHTGKLGRVGILYRNKFYKNTLSRTAGQFLSI